MKEEYQNYVKYTTYTHTKLNTRLQTCFRKMNIISKEKNSELKANKSHIANLDTKMKTYEEAIEKNKVNLKTSRETSLIKGAKLTENLELIEN